jgi:hypothetical protein
MQKKWWKECVVYQIYPLSFSILAPSIDVTANASATAIKPGQTVVFTATATTNGTPLSYQSKIGTTVIGSGAKINHQFNQPGIYSVIVTATDGCGFTDTYSLQVVVSKLKVYLAIVRK